MAEGGEIIYNTQPSDNQDKAIFEEIKRELGHKDKESFQQCLIAIYKGDPQELNHIRESVYDYAKDVCTEFPAGKLVSRRAKNNDTQAILNKYSQDIYYLFHYVEGGIPDHVLQSKVLSRASIKSLGNQSMCTAYQVDDDDAAVQTMDDDIPHGERDSISVILSHVIQLKQCISRGTDVLENKIAQLEHRLTSETKSLKASICDKDKLIHELSDKLKESEERRTELRAELKLCNQQSKTYRDHINELESEMLRLNYSVDAKLKVIENKITSISSKQRDICKSNHPRADECNGSQHKTDGPANASESCTTTPMFNANETHISVQRSPQSRRSTDAESNQQLQERETTSTTDDTTMTSNRERSDHYLDLTDRNYNYDFIYTAEQHETEPWNHVRSHRTSRPSSNANVPQEKKSQPIRSLAKSYRALEGVPRIRTKRIVLYNIKADEQFDSIKDLIHEYAQERRVRVTFVRLMKKKQHYNYQDTYTVQVNIDYDDYEDIISGDPDFWPQGIRARDYVPKNKMTSDNTDFHNNRY